MAFASTTVWEVRTTGDDANGGGYSSGGVDYSQQDSPQVSLTDMVIDGATNTIFSSATLGSNSNYIGNIINVTGGTGFTVQRVQIVSRSGANYTVDKSLGTLGSTGGTGKLGGAFASPGMAGSVSPFGGMTVFIKYGTYTLSTTTPNVSGGPLKIDSLAGSNIYLHVIGYDTTRTINNQDANRPTVLVPSSGVTSINVIDTNTYIFSVRFANIIVDGAGKSGIVGFDGNSWNQNEIYRCKAKDCVTGFNLSIDSAINCESVGHSATGFYPYSPRAILYGCVAHDGTGNGFTLNNHGTAINCIAYGNAKGFNIDNSYGCGAKFINCTAYNNSSSGFHCGTGNDPYYLNCLATNNLSHGFNLNSTQARMMNCFAGLNTSGQITSLTTNYGIGNNSSISAGPFTNPGSGDFSINNTAGGGAACRAAGFPGAFPGGLTTGYLDIGAVQHQDSGGGGSSSPYVIGS